MNIALDNLFFMFFGIRKNCIEKESLKTLCKICSERAYKDFCRTIEFKEIEPAIRKQLKEKSTNKISERINELIIDRQIFDKWHRSLCDEIIECYDLMGDRYILHYGQAQKWINMTFKYLRIMGVGFDDYSLNMHIPVDNYIIEAVSESKNNVLLDDMDVCGLGLKFECKKSWSRCDDYDMYLNFQKEIREATDNNQLEWEEKAWIAMALRHSMDSQ